MGRAEDAVISLSNYRLNIKYKESFINVGTLYATLSIDKNVIVDLPFNCQVNAQIFITEIFRMIVTLLG